MPESAQPEPQKKILIATSSPVLARGVEETLLGGGLDAPEVCRDLAHLHTIFLTDPPAVAILDSALLAGPGIIADLLATAPRCRLLLLDRGLSSAMAEYVSRPGVCQVLPPSISTRRLLSVVVAAVALPCRPALPAVRLRHALSAGERQLVAMVSHGISDTEIAAIRRCPERQVSREVNRLIRRLEISGRCELALYGMADTDTDNSFDSEMTR